MRHKSRDNSKDSKLVIVCGTLESGGAERVISILSKPFADNFDYVTIITWRDSPIFYKIDHRVSLVSLPTIARSNNNLLKIKSLRDYIKINKPNVILSFLTIFNLFTLISLIGIKIPIIVAERNDPHYIRGGLIMKLIRNWIYRKSDGILCQTQSIKDYFKGKLQSKTFIIYNPIILPDEYIGKALRTKKNKYIVSVGRLHPQKNQKLLIKAFKNFHKEHPDYKLIIYGTGPLKKELSEFIIRSKMEEFIILAGERKDVNDLILEAEAFVMTSDFEGMPNALIEAMCLGLPCISTKVSGATDLIKDRENGILVNSSVKDISEAMSTLTDNPELARSIARNATSLYKALKIDIISKQWINYLKSKSVSDLTKLTDIL